MKSKWLGLAFTLLFCSGMALTAGLDADTKAKVDAIFAEWDKKGSPGCALGIIKDGEWLYKRGYGYANLEYDIPISEKSVFRIGSTSKQFAAAAIALLAEQGKISLDDDIRKHVPELPEYEKTITVRHLVHHTSGIRDYLTLMYLSGARDDDFYTDEDVVASLARQKSLNFTPGSQHLYSNAGYFLLSVIVERASGKSLRQYADEHMFKPLGMNNTHFHDDHTYIVKNRASGYSPAENGFRINMTTLGMVGDGGVFTTIEDLKKWDDNFYNNRLGQTGPAFLDLIQTPGKLNDGEELTYAFGLSVHKHKGLNVVEHGGAFVGFRAQMMRFPDQRLTIMILANLGSMNPSRLAESVADVFLADAYVAEEGSAAAPKAPEAVTPKQGWLEAMAGSYLDVDTMAVMEMVIENGKLYRRMSGRPDHQLLPAGQSHVFYENLPLDIRFRKDGSGKITGFLLDRARMGQGNSEWKLMTPFSPEKKHLEQAAGNYYSPELDIVYTITLEGDALSVKVGKQPPLAIRLIQPDLFISDAGISGTFQSRNGKVEGFNLQAGRARNMMFEKQ